MLALIITEHSDSDDSWFSICCFNIAYSSDSPGCVCYFVCYLRLFVCFSIALLICYALAGSEAYAQLIGIEYVTTLL